MLMVSTLKPILEKILIKIKIWAINFLKSVLGKLRRYHTHNIYFGLNGKIIDIPRGFCIWRKRYSQFIKKRIECEELLQQTSELWEKVLIRWSECGVACPLLSYNQPKHKNVRPSLSISQDINIYTQRAIQYSYGHMRRKFTTQRGRILIQRYTHTHTHTHATKLFLWEKLHDSKFQSAQVPSPSWVVFFLFPLSPSPSHVCLTPIKLLL